MLKKLFQSFSKNSVKKFLLITLGTIFWSLVMVRSGLCWNKSCAGGLGFWGANGHDGIWHLSLINNFVNGNYDNPVFAGFPLQNYHIGFDLLISWIVRLTGISSSLIYFQIIPVILALAIGLLVYWFVEKWQHSKESAWWATFFVYFGGSFGWLISLVRGKGWGGESMFWSQQSISTLINPSFALSLVLILAGLILLIKIYKIPSFVSYLLVLLCFGILSGIKIYASLLILGALFVAGIYSLIVNHRSLTIKLFIGVLMISALLYFPLNKLSSDLVVWQPFWFLESMFALSDRFDWQKMYSAMTTYRMGDIWLKAVPAYAIAFGIFIIGNFGTRMIVLFGVGKRAVKSFLKDEIAVFLLTIVSAGISVPTLFVQKGTPWNTIQFFYYSLFFAGMFAGIIFVKFLKDNKINTILTNLLKVVIILLTIPTTIASIDNYVSKIPQSALPEKELIALDFLKNQPAGVVLTYPFDRNTRTDSSPIPLFQYTTTAYVSAYSTKPVFLEDEMNLGIMQYSFEVRRDSIEKFLNTLNEKQAYDFLRINNIKYIYWLKDQYVGVGDAQLGLTKIFDNGGVKIFQVNY